MPSPVIYWVVSIATDMIDVKEEQIRLLAKQLKIPTFAEYKNVLNNCAPDSH